MILCFSFSALISLWEHTHLMSLTSILLHYLLVISLIQGCQFIVNVYDLPSQLLVMGDKLAFLMILISKHKFSMLM